MQILIVIALLSAILLINFVLQLIARFVFKRNRPFFRDATVWMLTVGVVVGAIVYGNYGYYRSEANYNRTRRIFEARYVLKTIDRELKDRAGGKEFKIESLTPYMRGRSAGPVRVYLEEKDVPTEIKALLRPDELPFVRKYMFRIISLGALKDKTILYMKENEMPEGEFRTRELDYNLRSLKGTR